MSTTLVYLHWLDSAYVRDADPERFGPVEIHSVGWLVRDDDVCVVLAMESQPAEDVYRDLLAVPHFAVINRADMPFELYEHAT